MIASILVGFLIFVAASLVAAIIGTALRPRPPFDAFENYPQAAQPWAATRCAGESLDNFKTAGSQAPSGETGMVVGRMYAAPPSSGALDRLPKSARAFFRRAL